MGLEDLLQRAETRLREVRKALGRAQSRHVATPTTGTAKDVHMLMGMETQLVWFVEELRTMQYHQGDLGF